VQQWRNLKTTDIPQLNGELQKAGLAPLQISEIEREVVYQMTR
jgi:hypothetical protein